jgi:hypothetical protein
VGKEFTRFWIEYPRDLLLVQSVPREIRKTKAHIVKKKEKGSVVIVIELADPLSGLVEGGLFIQSIHMRNYPLIFLNR